MSTLTRALIRRCDSCGAMTAFDLRPTPERERDMQHTGHTVSLIDAVAIWGERLGCQCRVSAPDQEFDRQCRIADAQPYRSDRDQELYGGDSSEPAGMER